MNGNLPKVRENVELIKGWFSDTLPEFIESKKQKVSFIHMDADLYSSTKTVLNILKPHLDSPCVIVFDELVNYAGFDGDTGELKALYEFINENKDSLEMEWVGMNGTPIGMRGYEHQNVALLIYKL